MYAKHCLNMKTVTTCSRVTLVSCTCTGNYHRLTALRTKNPDLKILLSVGGWKSGSKGFSAVVASKAARQTFINNAVTFLRRHRLDGLDMDWEYPGMRDSPQEDSEKYCQLLQVRE